MKFPEDLNMIRAVRAGDRLAWERFVRRITPPLWGACKLLTRDEAETRLAFAVVVEALSAEGYRRLGPYSGASRIETYIILICTRR